MKKVILFIAVMLLSLQNFAQNIERETLYESKKGFKIIESKSETSSLTFFYWGFRNAKYKHISDTGGLFITKKENLELFYQKLLEFSNLEKGKNVSFTVKDFGLSAYDFTDSIFVSDDKGKYFVLSKKVAREIAEEILSKLSLLKE